MDLDFIAWFDLSKLSNPGLLWQFFFHEWQISISQRSRRIPPLSATFIQLVYHLLGQSESMTKLCWLSVVTFLFVTRSLSDVTQCFLKLEIAATQLLKSLRLLLLKKLPAAKQIAGKKTTTSSISLKIIPKNENFLQICLTISM